MTFRQGYTPFLFIAAMVGLASAIILFRASPMAVTLMAVSVLMLMLTFIMPELTLHFVVAAMLLSPEVAVAKLGGISGGHSAVTLRLEDFLLIFLGFSMLARIAIMKELSDLGRSPLNRAILAYFGSCLLATAFGVLRGYVNPAAGFFYVLKYFEYYFIYFMVFTTIHDEAQIKRLRNTFFFTAACVIVYGFWQIPAGGRLTAPFEGEGGSEPNTLGGYLVFVISLAMGHFAEARGYFRKSAWGFFILAAAIAVLYTLSRASWVAAIPMLLVLVLLYRRQIPLLAFALPMLVFGWFFFAPRSLRERVSIRVEGTFTADPRGEADYLGIPLDSSTVARITNLSTALRQWVQDPILGRGVTGWGLADTHWARLIGETGALGVIAFLWLLLSVVKHALRARDWIAERGTVWKGLVNGYLVGIAAILGHSLGTETFVIVRIMEPFWFITALVLVLPSVLPQPEPAATDAVQPAHLSIRTGQGVLADLPFPTGR